MLFLFLFVCKTACIFIAIIVDRPSHVRFDAATFSNRAAARLASGDAAGALEDGERAAALAPTHAKPHFRMGKALMALGRHLDAAVALARSLGLLHRMDFMKRDSGGTQFRIDKAATRRDLVRVQ